MYALFTSLVLLAGARADDPPPGNVLILVADDFGLDQMRVYGVASNPPPTPNLDLLAASGVVFRNVWSQPTCSPTRATLQTGRYGFRTGIGATIDPFTGGPALPLSEVTLPEMLDLGTGGDDGDGVPGIGGFLPGIESHDADSPRIGQSTSVIDEHSGVSPLLLRKVFRDAEIIVPEMLTRQ